MPSLEQILGNRIAIIDGAMGTTIRTYGMTEADIRGARFADAKKDLLNNGDLFSLTQPKMIGDIHRRFLEAGADIIETNTFGATSITQSEFFVDDPRERGGRKDPAFYQGIIESPFLNDLAWEINEQSARQCREWAERVGSADGRPRFVAGAVGPLTVSLSSSPDADDAGFRVVTFDQVKAAYALQVRALIAGGVDLLLVETIFDSLNAKAALVAIREVSDELGRELPLIISAAVGRGGETMISAQTAPAFWNAVEHVRPLAVGLNCSLGPDLMYPFLSELSAIASAAISCYPNAGLPNPLSPTGFDLQPADMARYLGEFADAGLAQHRRRLLRQHPRAHRRHRRALDGKPPRPLPSARRASARPLRLSGSQPFTQQQGVYMIIGERTNVAGSPKFAKLIKEGNYEEAVSVARQQVESGANVIDVCMDEGMIDGVAAMTRFLSAPRQRARGGEGAVHDRLLQVGGHRGRPQVPARQGHRQLHLAQGGRGQVPPERAQRDEVRRRRGGDGVRRAGPGGDPRATRSASASGPIDILVDELGLPRRGHHLRSQRAHRRHRHRGAQQLRGRLHRGHPLDQGQPAAAPR